MRRTTMLAALAAAAAMALTGCTHASEELTGTVGAPASAPSVSVPVHGVSAAADLLPQQYRGGTLTYATDASYPPFEMFASDNTTIIGFDPDVMADIAGRLGMTPHPVNAGLDGILTGLESGRYEAGISSFSITPEREQKVDFVSYMQGGAGIAVPPGNPQHLAMDWHTLCGHSIAAQKGTTQAIEQLPELNKECIAAGKAPIAISLFPSQNDTILAIASGRVEGMMSDSAAIAYQAKLSNGKFELAPGPAYLPRQTGIALPKGSPLRPALAAAVKEMYADGTIAKLATKWSVPETNLTATPGE